MSPLSAIQSLVASDVSPLRRSAAESTAAIPFSELKELGPAAHGLSNNEPPAVFGSLLGNLVNEVNNNQAVAGEAVRGLLDGHNVSLHQAVIAMEEANVSFQLMVEVRNRLLESYQELMRMQV